MVESRTSKLFFSHGTDFFFFFWGGGGGGGGGGQMTFFLAIYFLMIDGKWGVVIKIFVFCPSKAGK